MKCMCICMCPLYKYSERHIHHIPHINTQTDAHTDTPTLWQTNTLVHTGWTFWLMTVICQAEVDKTVNIIFVLRAGAHHLLPPCVFHKWLNTATRRQHGSQQIYSHYSSIRTSASTDQALHLYTDTRKRKRGRWRVKRGREEEWQWWKKREMGKRRGSLKCRRSLDISEFD